MTFTNLYKQLKKRLRRARRTLQLGCFLLLSAGLVWALSQNGDEQAAEVFAKRSSEEPVVDKVTEGTVETLSRISGTVPVIMDKEYLCGTESTPVGNKDTQEIISMLTGNPRYSAVMAPDGTLHVKEQIQDLSPACKDNAFIGMDEKGNLTLYDTQKGEKKAVRTFFQLDVKQMESSLPEETLKQLYSGIKVSDVDEYNSVISTFSDFAVEEAKRVMSQDL
ncbi:BofC C-terminal domain-containing protein [Paenibacillus gansuensis]|uniref:BofC C-terminal domain-containing protein n=1 Tax=Paenibacillus gansuensis TaxID=306542 RepID=A0ABW5PDL5_9BACL